jgi:hypothetical protein
MTLTEQQAQIQAQGWKSQAMVICTEQPARAVLNNSGVVFQLTHQGRVTPLSSFSLTEVTRQDAYNANLQRQ